MIEPLRVEIVEMGEGRMEISGARLVTMPMYHTPESIGFRIELGSSTLVYTGDTGPCDNLYTLCSGAEMLICECSFPDDKRVDHHMSPLSAGELARDTGVKRLVLTHIYPSTDSLPIEDIISKVYSGRIIVARDGMVLEV